MSDALLGRDDSPIGEELWQVLDHTMLGVARGVGSCAAAGAQSRRTPASSNATAARCRIAPLGQKGRTSLHVWLLIGSPALSQTDATIR